MNISTILSLKRHCPVSVDEGFDGDLLVKSGTVWLTTARTAGDCVLQAGERRQIVRMAGAVVQAVGAEARVLLLPAHRCCGVSRLQRLMEASIR